MSSFDFSDDEIRDELRKLGYSEVSPSRLQQFKQDLQQLVVSEKTQSSWTTTDESAIEDTPNPSPMSPEYNFNSSARPYNHSRVDGRSAFFKEPGLLREGLAARQTQQAWQTRAPRAPSPSESDCSSRRMVKRKVVRRVNGERIVDESFTESETDTSAVREAVRERLPLRTRRVQQPEPYHSDPESQLSEEPYSRPTSSRGLPSYIRPNSAASHPHEAGLRRSDPVARYAQYARSWGVQRAPGEKQHGALRWGVREALLTPQQPGFKRPQRVYEANSYVVPTDKKRSALRWKVRSEIANGVMPSAGGAWEL